MTVQGALQNKLVQRLAIGVGMVVLLTLGGQFYGRWLRSLNGDFTKAEAREWTLGILFPSLVMGGVYFLNYQAHRRSESQKLKIEQAIQEHRQQLEFMAVKHQQLLAQVQQERKEQLDRAKEERKEDREQTERERLQAQEQAEFKFYLDRMATLVIDAKITCLSGDSEVLQLAQALTAHILRSLSETRMNQVIFFLRSLNLTAIKTEDNPQSHSLLEGIQLDDAELINLHAPLVNFRDADLRRANLRGAMLRGASFEQAYLDGANLLGAYLGNAHLYGASLYGAHLEGTYFKGANLAGANLKKTYLVGADLRGANLVGAHLAEANLSRVNFRGANLEAVNFEDAVFSNTTMPDGSIR